MRKLSEACGCSPWYVPERDKITCGVEGNECIAKRLKAYKDDLQDRKECNCLNDCEMVHFFSTMIRESYELHRDISQGRWFDPDEPDGGILANYLLDPKDIFADPLTKSLIMLAANVTDMTELAEIRFKEDIAVLNFFFDTPIITQINLELRTSVFDMISAIGGTLGLFTGISVITFVEIVYWLFRFVAEAFGESRLFNKLTLRRSESRVSNDDGLQLHQTRSRDYLFVNGDRNNSVL